MYPFLYIALFPSVMPRPYTLGYSPSVLRFLSARTVDREGAFVKPFISDGPTGTEEGKKAGRGWGVGR